MGYLKSLKNDSIEGLLALDKSVNPIQSIPLISSKCLSLKTMDKACKFYSESCYLETKDGRTPVSINGESYYRYNLHVKINSSKFPEEWSEISSYVNSTTIAFNRDFSGIVTEVTSVNEDGTYSIIVEVYSTQVLSAEYNSRIFLSDNSFAVSNIEASRVIIDRESPSRVQHDTKTATYGVFNSIYSSKDDISVEFPASKIVATNSGSLISDLINPDLHYLDLGILEEKHLKYVNSYDYSVYNGTINMNGSEFTKFFYLASINRSFFKERNSVNFNIKADLT